ncbi:WhiB family transcriptional regulator [Streptomyces scabiei]|uniref:WhiB family transcriptional regulator n=1 Tax=Streptomyces scabiei TaxID=1930 RepID=UPI0007661398
MTGTEMTDVRRAYVAWTEHRFFKYRGCAPDVDDPSRAAGDPGLSLDAWHGPDVDGGEPQKERRAREAAAKAVCARCPVLAECAAYASTVSVEGKLVEPDGIRGGRTALERHRAFIQHRHEVAEPAPAVRFQTKQKQDVLAALAGHSDPCRVAEVAGVDWRTASWQRSRLVTQLNLCKVSATRMQVLEEAVARGLLDGSLVVADDGSVPAVPPSPPVPAPAMDPALETAAPVADGPEPGVGLPGSSEGAAGPLRRALGPSGGREDAAGADGPVAADLVEGAGGPGQATPYEPVRVHSPRRDRFAAVHGQLSLDDVLADLPGPVRSRQAVVLFPHPVRLEPAA